MNHLPVPNTTNVLVTVTGVPQKGAMGLTEALRVTRACIRPNVGQLTVRHILREITGENTGVGIEHRSRGTGHHKGRRLIALNEFGAVRRVTVEAVG
jgi:hypothetical protein